MENLKYLFAAYGVVWTTISLYLFYIGRKQSKIIQEIEKIKKIG